jgi:hypothetical protein
MLGHNRFGAMITPDSQSPARLPCPIHDDDSGRRTDFSQGSDCSISSSCLSRSVNSIARRRNWRATAARRCSSSARRASRPMLCASVCMVVAPGGLAVKLQTPQCAAGALIWPARHATDSTIDKQPTPTRDRHPSAVPTDRLSAHRRRPPACSRAVGGSGRCCHVTPTRHSDHPRAGHASGAGDLLPRRSARRVHGRRHRRAMRPSAVRRF